MRNSKRIFPFIFALMMGSAASAASPASFTYEGVLTDSNGNSVDLSGRTITFSIINGSNCVIYSESSTASGDANGNITQAVGTGTVTFGTFNASLFNSNLTGSGGCSVTSTEPRYLYVSVSSLSLSATVNLTSVPYALEATAVGGYAASSILRTDSSVASVTPLNSTQYAKLTDLIAGSSTQYVQQGSPVFSSQPQFSGSPSGTNDLTNKGYVDSAINTAVTAALPNVGTPGTYFKVVTDSKGRVTSGAAALTEADIPQLTSAGKVSGGAITSGTIGGTTNISTTGTVSSSGVSTKSLAIWDSGNSKSVSLSTSSSGSTYSLIFPLNAPSAGKLLSTDTTGQLTWVAPTSAPPDADYATKGIIRADTDAATSGLAFSSSGVLKVNAGTGANQIVKLDGLSKIPAVDGSQLTNLSAAQITAGILPISRGGTGQSTKVAAFDSLSPTSTKGDLIVHNGTNNVSLPLGGNGQVLTADSSLSSGVKWANASTGTVTNVTAGAGLTGGTITSTGTLSVNMGTGANQVVQLDGLSRLPAVNGSQLTNLSLSQINSGTLPVSLGGTGQSSYTDGQLLIGNSVGNTLTKSTLTAGSGITISNGNGSITISATGSGGTVTGVDVAVPSYMTSSGGAITTSGTIALGFGSQTAKAIFAAPQGASGTPNFRLLNIMDIQSTAGGNFLTGSNCSSGQALAYNSVTDTISCQNLIPSVANNATLSNTKIWVGDASNKAQEVAMSGDATLSSTGALTLASTGVTASTYKSVTVDGKGRVTSGTNPTSLSGFGITDAVQNASGVPSVSAGIQASRPTAGVTGRIFVATDTFRTFRDNGTSWDQLNVNAADLTGTLPTGRLPAFTGDVTSAAGSNSLTLNTVTLSKGGTGLTSGGSANQILGMNGTGSGAEFKTINAGSGVTVSHAANSITISATAGGTMTGPIDMAGYGISNISQTSYKDSGSNTVTIKAPAAVTPYTLTLPPAVGGTNQILMTDSSGVLSWTNSSLSGDVSSSGAFASTTVNKIKGTPVSATPTASGQVLKYDGAANYTPGFINNADLRSSVVPYGPIFPTNCSSSQTLLYDVPNDKFYCANISVTSGNFSNQSANAVFAGPTSGPGSGAPSFRGLVAADIPALSTSQITSGTFGAAFGGTGYGAYANGDMLYASGTSALSKLTIGGSGTILTSNGSTPAWSGAPTLSTSLTAPTIYGSSLISGNLTIDSTSQTTKGNIYINPTNNGIVVFGQGSPVGPGDPFQVHGTSKFDNHIYVENTGTTSTDSTGLFLSHFNSNSSAGAPLLVFAAANNGNQSNGISANSAVGKIQFQNPTASWNPAAEISAVATSAFSSSNSATRLEFRTTATSSNIINFSKPQMVIDQSGFVGIGTSGISGAPAPSTVLDITRLGQASLSVNSYNSSTGDANASILSLRKSCGTSETSITACGASTTVGQLTFESAINAPNSYVPAAIIKSTQKGSAGTGELSFWTSQTSGTPSQRVTIDSTGNMGIGTSTPVYKLDVNGDVNIAATSNLRFGGTSVCTSTGCTSSSDERLKVNIAPLSGSLEKVLQLQGVEYDYRDKKKYGDRHQVGVIAQSVEKVYPEVVVTDEKTNLKSVAYDHLVAPLIEAVKSLYNRLISVENRQSAQERDIASVEDEFKVIKAENVQLKQENAEMKARLDQIEKLLKSKRH